MKKIIAFAGSNSKQSINKQLASYTANLVENANVEVLNLNDFNLPLYGIDYEAAYGIPENAKMFLEKITDSDGVVISLAEHNGAYTSAFKNLFDWMSRINGKLWSNKPMLLMATSPGARGGISVLEIAKDRFPRHDANIIATFSLPSFNDNFSEGKLINKELNKQLLSEVEKFANSFK